VVSVLGLSRATRLCEALRNTDVVIQLVFVLNTGPGAASEDYVRTGRKVSSDDSGLSGWFRLKIVFSWP
jgi:hypothetical protein